MESTNLTNKDSYNYFKTNPINENNIINIFYKSKILFLDKINNKYNNNNFDNTDFPQLIKNNQEFFQKLKIFLEDNNINDSNFNNFNNNNKDKKFFGYFHENIILNFLKNLEIFLIEKKFPYEFEELKNFQVYFF